MLEDPLSSDVYILNEYDTIIHGHSFAVRQQSIRGIWELRQKKVFAFSATSSPAHERILDSCIGAPTILKFKSEYEMMHDACPIVDPVVYASKSNEDRMQSFEAELERQYENFPVVIIHDEP
jgi:hypothetical protein